MWAGLLGVTMGALIRRTGFLPRIRRVRPSSVLPPTLVALAILITGAVLHLAYDALWPSFAAAGVVAVMVLVLGWVVRRTARASE